MNTSAGFVMAVATGVVISIHAIGDSDAARSIPTTFPGNPGNVFIRGQEVKMPLPAGTNEWTLQDYEGTTLRKITSTETNLSLGRLEVGFYRLSDPGAEQHWISLAVIAPLRAPTPHTSPIALDLALAGYKTNEMAAAANLAVLAGVNRSRDRLGWQEMEPAPGKFAGESVNDASVRAQHAAGLQTLQVIANSPTWANPDIRRFPPDLRDAYRFFSAVAGRWKNEVQAFEPWNEADYERFGGHTGSEMASFQKAAYLGLKNGNPRMIVCQNVWAFDRETALADFDANAAWPYFDTYNQHHYDPFDRLPPIYAHHRRVAAGKPMWVTECAYPVFWSGDPNLQEPSDADLRIQSETVTKTYASSLAEGSAATFYFLFPHYVEGRYQFGLMRRDLTPRPGYLALCAVGRLLSDARPLGRWRSEDAGTRAFLFRARPDGIGSDVLVAWSTNSSGGKLSLPSQPTFEFDHLGRSLPPTREVQLASAPKFALFKAGIVSRSLLIPPPTNAPLRTGTIGPVIFQSIAPTNVVVLTESAYRLDRQPSQVVKFYAYNFGKEKVSGKLEFIAENGWRVSGPGSIALDSMERQEMIVTIDGTSALPHVHGSLILHGDFGKASRPTLSIQLVPPSFGMTNVK